MPETKVWPKNFPLGPIKDKRLRNLIRRRQ